MYKFKIGTRLAFGFTVLIVMTVLMVGFAGFRFTPITSSAKFMEENNLPRMRMIVEAATAVQDITRTVGLIVSIEDPEFRKTARARLDEERELYRKKLKEIESMPTADTVAGKKFLAALEVFKTAIAKCSAANNKAMDAAVAGKREEALVLLKAAIPEIKMVNDASNQLLNAQQEAVETRLKNIIKSLNVTQTTMVVLSIFVILLSVAIGVITTRSITKPVEEMRGMLDDIANGEGDLTKKLVINGTDELSEVSRLFNLFVEKLHANISKITINANNIASASAQLHSTSEEISRESENAAARVSSVATAGEEMSSTSYDIAKNCMMAAEGARQASDAAMEGAKVVNETISVMGEIASRVQSTAEAVENLGCRSEQIGEIVGTIEDIADQTNLLALNAAIEAARAGEQGRGFAVVADEVRALAERTTKATKEIGEMIKTIQSETKAAVNVMNEGVSDVAAGSQKAAMSGEALEHIQTQINDVSMQISQVATAAEEQTATTEEISGNMHQINDVIAQASRGAGQSVVAAEHLSGSADELKYVVSQFKL